MKLTNNNIVKTKNDPAEILEGFILVTAYGTAVKLKR